MSLAEDTKFYLGTIKNPKTTTWFKAANLGKNKLGALAKTMATKAGIPYRVTNHGAGRRTSITTLLADGVSENRVMQLSGHKNITSLNTYHTATMAQQKDVSDRLTKYFAIKAADVPDEPMPVPDKPVPILLSDDTRSDVKTPDIAKTDVAMPDVLGTELEEADLPAVSDTDLLEVLTQYEHQHQPQLEGQIQKLYDNPTGHQRVNKPFVVDIPSYNNSLSQTKMFTPQLHFLNNCTISAPVSIYMGMPGPASSNQTDTD